MTVTYPLPLDDPCGVSAPVVPSDDPKRHHAACPLCDYTSVPMAAPQARAAAVQHALTVGHRTRMRAHRAEAER